MRMFLTILTMPVITLIVALTVQEFFLGITLSVVLSFLSYLCWDWFINIIKKEEV